MTDTKPPEDNHKAADPSSLESRVARLQETLASMAILTHGITKHLSAHQGELERLDLRVIALNTLRHLSEETRSGKTQSSLERMAAALERSAAANEEQACGLHNAASALDEGLDVLAQAALFRRMSSQRKAEFLRAIDFRPEDLN